MNKAWCKVGNLGWRIVDIEEVKSGDVKINDIAGNIHCPICGAVGWIKCGDELEWHFAFNHEPDCEIIINSNSKHKSYIVYTGDVVHEDDMMNKNVYRSKHNNSEIDKSNDIDDDFNVDESTGEITDNESEELADIDYDAQENLKPTKQYVDDIDCVKVFRVNNIFRPIGLYKLILKVGIHQPVLPDGRCGDDILLDNLHLKKIRDEGMEETKKLAIVTRTGTKLLKHPFYIPKGYSLLRDIYAVDKENSIFFLVKITDNELNKMFQRELMGDKDNREKTRNKHRDLLIYHNWRRYPNDFYQIYISEIGNCAYSFVNMAHDKKR